MADRHPIYFGSFQDCAQSLHACFSPFAQLLATVLCTMFKTALRRWDLLGGTPAEVPDRYDTAVSGGSVALESSSSAAPWNCGGAACQTPCYEDSVFSATPRLYFAAALDVESHSSFRGTKPSFCFAYALEAPRSRIA